MILVQQNKAKLSHVHMLWNILYFLVNNMPDNYVVAVAVAVGRVGRCQNIAMHLDWPGFSKI